MRVARWPHVPDLLMADQDLAQQNRDLIDAVKALRWELYRLVAYASHRDSAVRCREWLEAEKETSEAMSKVWHLL